MPTVLVVDDGDVTAPFVSLLERAARCSVELVTASADLLTKCHACHPDLLVVRAALSDATGADLIARAHAAYAPELAAIVVQTRESENDAALQALRQGAEGLVTLPADLAIATAVAERALERGRLRRLEHHLHARRGAPRVSSLGQSQVMRDLAQQIQLLASDNTAPVLLHGEHGAGKGRVAELIHALGERRQRPFVEVTCAAHTAQALEAELFGGRRERATRDTAGGPPDAERPGAFEIADGGVLFLDEVGALDAVLQVKVLHVLDSRAFCRPGTVREVSVDVRVVAASATDLVTEVTEGRFREDLYYRLSVMPLYVPPLRARSDDDLRDLVAAVLGELHPALPAAPRTIAPDALERLVVCHWPGNVRELRNVLERAMVLARAGGAASIETCHLPAEMRGPGAGANGVEGSTDAHVARTLEDVERAHIERTLRGHHGNRTHAARELAISRATLIKKIKDYGLTGREQ